MLSLSQAVPAGPTVAIRGTDRAEPSCTDSIAVRARPHGGTPERARAACSIMPNLPVPDPSAAIRRRATRDVGTEPGQVGDEVVGGGGSASSVIGSSASRMNSAAVVSSRELGAAGLAPVPAPAGHAGVVAPHHLAAVGVLEHRVAVGDGVEGLRRRWRGPAAASRRSG